MALEILGDPFASQAQTALDETSIRDVAPSMPDTKVQDLIRASNNEQWDKQEGINEKYLLDKKLTSLASTLSAELGPFALDSYEGAQSVISASVLRVLNEGDRTGSFRGSNARGGSQWDIQQLTPQSFSGTAADRVYQTGTSGNFDIIPNHGGDATDDTETLDTDTQTVLILGYYANTNPRAVDQVQLGIDDGESRTPEDVYARQNLGTLQAYNSGSVEYITDDDEFDLNGSATSDTETDLYPFGVDVNTAAALPNLGVQG